MTALTVSEIELGTMRNSEDDNFLELLEEELGQIDEEIIQLEADKKRQSLGIDRKIRALKKKRRQLMAVIADAEELGRLIERNLKAGVEDEA